MTTAATPPRQRLKPGRQQSKHVGVDWYLIRTRFVTSSVSAESLAREFSVSVHALRRRIALQHWAAARKEFALKVEADAIRLAAQNNARLLREWNERDIEIFTAARSIAARELLRIGKGQSTGASADEMTIGRLTATLLDCQRGARIALGADSEKLLSADAPPAPTPEQLWAHLESLSGQASPTNEPPPEARPRQPTARAALEHQPRAPDPSEPGIMGEHIPAGTVEPAAAPDLGGGFERFARAVGVVLPPPPGSNVLAFVGESDAQRARRLERERQHAWNDARDAELKAGLLERERRMRAEAGEADESGEGAA